MADIIKQVILGVVVFIIPFYLSQALEKSITAMADFPLKNVFLLLIPCPEDSVLEFLQFIAYWAGGLYFAFFRDK